jgi:hypothetical protein
LPDKSKKVSKFSYTTLEIAETLDQLGHAVTPVRGTAGKLMEVTSER